MTTTVKDSALRLTSHCRSNASSVPSTGSSNGMANLESSAVITAPITSAPQRWLGRPSAAHIAFIQPCKPRQNAYVDHYNRTVRYDWLAHRLFETLDDI
ncbi:transposase [Janthinobacterium violaceinigrum]|uniref:Transposase n=1 Tax=Janthinobacterium violaceinigrum TaxID=2654252 RepID=A0A6I1IG71_9BURK|nr:transposase [Janthinobacterium violaceinigrum]